MNRLLAAVLVASVLLAAGPAFAGTTLLDQAGEVRAGALALVARAKDAGELTWGQQTAVDDLRRLARAAEGLVEAMGSGSPEVTPRSLESARQDLDVARNRVRASFELLALPEGDEAALLAAAERLSRALRSLDSRFWGLSQPRGEGLASFPVDEAGKPLVYSGPEDLVREARGVYSNTQAMLADYSRRLPGVGWPGRIGGGYGGTYYGSELRDLVLAASDFETAVQSRYSDVEETRGDWRRLRRCWRRVQPYFGGSYGSFAAIEMERAMRRLDAFYGEVQDD